MTSLTKDKLFSKIISANFSLIVADLLLIFIKKDSLPEKLPLFYSRPWGEEQLANKNFLFLIPLLSFMVLIINYYLSLTLVKKKEKFLIVVSQGFALLFSALGTITLGKIIFLIG